MQTARAIVFGTVMVLAMLLTPPAYKRWRDTEFRNFRVVEAGVLYRSGQLSLRRLEQIVYERGIRTVISLRDGDAPIDRDEENWVKAHGLTFVRIPAKKWAPEPTGEIPAESALAEFRRVMDDPANYPVLVHCFAGVHRTGTMVAIFRMDYQGWTSAEAITEMRAMGYHSLDNHTDVHDFMMRYQAPARTKSVAAVPTAHKKNPLP
jgi:protein tyrosine/serine phosphatase